MQIFMKMDGKEVIKEIYKVQISLFGEPSLLIYNEDRTQIYETQDIAEIRDIQEFIGEGQIKTYVAGYQDEDGQIIMERIVPNKISRWYRW